MSASIDKVFIEKQKQHLTRLRAQILASAGRTETEEQQVNDASLGGASDRGEDAQRLNALETAGNIAVHDEQRLEQVNRALEKIAQGSYGVSDVSGKPIPRERLEAVPEATCTVAEEGEAARGRA